MKLLKTLLLVLLTVSAVTAMTQEKDIQTFTLDNGMKFIVLEDHDIPNATFYIFWKVGSRNEVPGITGLSHFFEHMMFLGSENYGPGEFDRVMEANGGANNAYTTEDVTVYMEWFPAQALETIFTLESDRVGKLEFNDERIESERAVVTSERVTRLENSNFSRLNSTVKPTAMSAHPYRWPVIGHQSDIRNWKKSDLQNYFKTYYAPNNGVAVVVGDLDLEKVKKLAQEYFGPIPAQEPARPIHTVEPEQNGEKRVIEHKQVSTPNLMMVHHVPNAKHEDYYALDMLQAILSDGRSSRLYSSLVDQQQKAVEIFSYYPTSFDPFLFYIYGVCNQDVSESELETAILDELEKIKTNGVTEQELQKIKNRKLVTFYKNMATIDGKASTIGDYEIYFGDYKKLFSAPEAYQAVTVDDIKRVANTYFTKSNRTVGILIPAEEDQL